MLSIIPDIHADMSRLRLSLKMMGGAAPIAFLGDLIDAGANVKDSDDRAVLHLVNLKREYSFTSHINLFKNCAEQFWHHGSW